MNIFRWISDATNSRDRRRLEEARLRRNYQSIALYRHSPRTWSEPTPRVTTAEYSPRIVFVSPDPDTMPDHHRHHRRRRHERVESLTTDIPRYYSYVPSCRTPYTYSQGYSPWYPTPQLHGNITNYPTTPSINITSAHDSNVQSAREASYAQTEQTRDRRRTREITRLTDDLRAEDSDDARRERTHSRRHRYGQASAGQYLDNETDRGVPPRRNEQEIRHRIAELEASIRERESRRDPHRERRSRNNTGLDALTDGIGGLNLPGHYRRPRSFVPDEIRHDWSDPVSISREPSRPHSCSDGYLRPRVRFSPTASCYRGYNTPRGGYESSGSEEVYYGGCRY